MAGLQVGLCVLQVKPGRTPKDCWQSFVMLAQEGLAYCPQRLAAPVMGSAAASCILNHIRVGCPWQ